jgi:hypothetical protein
MLFVRFTLLQSGNVLSISCFANACLICLQSLQLSSEAYLDVLDRHGRTPAWYREFWKQPVLLPSERELPAWVPTDKTIRITIRLGPSRKLMEELAADRLERADSGVEWRAGAETNKAFADQSGGSGQRDESSAALGGVGGGEEERRAAAKRAKRAQKKKKKNGAAEDLEGLRVGESGAMAPVGEQQEQFEALKALGWLVEESDGAPTGSRVAAAKDSSGEEGVVQADATAPQSGSEAHPSLASISGAGENQGAVETSVDWSKMTPQQIGDLLRETQWSADDIQSMRLHVSLAKHLLGVGEVAYARFTAHFREKGREYDGRVFDSCADLLRRLDGVSKTILIDLVVESAKKSADLKEEFRQQVQSGRCSIDDMRPWVLCNARLALLQAAAVKKLFSDLHHSDDDTVRGALSYARAEVNKARVLVSNLRWSHPPELQGFIESFEVEKVRGELYRLVKVGVKKGTVGDEADAGRESLLLLKKAVVALEALMRELSVAHRSMTRILEALTVSKEAAPVLGLSGPLRKAEEVSAIACSRKES